MRLLQPGVTGIHRMNEINFIRWSASRFPVTNLVSPFTGRFFYIFVFIRPVRWTRIWLRGSRLAFGGLSVHFLSQFTVDRVRSTSSSWSTVGDRKWSDNKEVALTVPIASGDYRQASRITSTFLLCLWFGTCVPVGCYLLMHESPTITLDGLCLSYLWYGRPKWLEIHFLVHL